MPRPTLGDVARACGVSSATVSKALNPHADRCDVSAKTRERVLAAARAVGFRPSASHSRRTRRLWRNIGLMWGRFAPFTTGVYEGILDAIGGRLTGAGWRLLYTPVPDAESWRTMQMAQRLDGVLAVSHVPDAVLADLARASYPAVLLNLRTGLALPQFIPDDLGGCVALAEHLADLGHRRIVYLAHRPAGVDHSSESERPAGLGRVVKARGMRITTLPGGEFAVAVRACRAGATAVVCYEWNDIPGVLQALAAAGLAVPARVSVACCADLRWFAHLTPSVTALEIPLQALAVRAVDRLLALIDAGSLPGAPETVVLPEILRVRGSTGPAPRLR